MKITCQLANFYGVIVLLWSLFIIIGQSRIHFGGEEFALLLAIGLPSVLNGLYLSGLIKGSESGFIALWFKRKRLEEQKKIDQL
jgi:hypothetical protein